MGGGNWLCGAAFNSTQNGAHLPRFVFAGRCASMCVCVFVCERLEASLIEVLWCAWPIISVHACASLCVKSPTRPDPAPSFLNKDAIIPKWARLFRLFIFFLSCICQIPRLFNAAFSPLRHNPPLLADASLKSKRRDNGTIVTSLFLIWTTIKAFIQMLLDAALPLSLSVTVSQFSYSLSLPLSPTLRLSLSFFTPANLNRSGERGMRIFRITLTWRRFWLPLTVMRSLILMSENTQF